MTDTNSTMDQFTPEDIFAAVMLIDHACNHGAFRGWDNISKAHVVRERLARFAESWKSISLQNQEGDQA